MVHLNSAEDHEAGSSQSPECSAATGASSTSNCCPQQPPHTQCNHLFQKAADLPEHVPNAGRASTPVPSHPKSGPASSNQTETSNAGVSMSGRKVSLGSAPGPEPRNSPTWLTTEEPIRQQRTHFTLEDPLQWLQALELQVVGACRSDERLRPLLRWNVSCFGSDGRLLAHLGQHFKARELALLARCLCTPVVSLRVGKVSRHGRFLYPTSARGYLHLVLLPCSEMRLSFADDLGTVERVAVTIPGVESGGILIEELEQDSSRRTFALKDRQGNVTNYFWQSEKLKSMGDELITKIRAMLKRRPTLAHLTGIDEGRLDAFADYLRTAIFAKPSNLPTQLAPASSDKSPFSSQSATLVPLRKPLFMTFPKLFTPTDSQTHIIIPSQAPRMGELLITCSPPFESSMEKLRRCMQEIEGPLSAFASSLPATARLIESLKRLRNCLHSLCDRTCRKAAPCLLDITDSNSTPFGAPHVVKYVIKLPIRSPTQLYHPRAFFSPELPPVPVDSKPSDSLCPCHSIWDNIDAQQGVVSVLVAHEPVQYCPKSFSFRRPLVFQSGSRIFSDMFTQLVWQLPRMMSRMSNERRCTHCLYVLPVVVASSSRIQAHDLSVLPHHHHHLQRGSLLLLPASGLYGELPFSLRNSLPDPRGGVRVPGQDSRQEPSHRVELLCQDTGKPQCHRCAPGAGLGNLVLVNFYAHQTGPRLRVVTAEITSGNISYIIVSRPSP